MGVGRGIGNSLPKYWKPPKTWKEKKTSLQYICNKQVHNKDSPKNAIIEMRDTFFFVGKKKS